MYLLIVDDDKLICENICSKLTRLGYTERYTLLTAHSATEAEVLYDKHLPQIVITDLHMPPISGLALIEQLRKREHQASIFVLSGYDDYEYVRRAFLLGVTDYLLKPLDIDEIDQKLKKLEVVPGQALPQEPPAENDSGKLMRLALDYIDENIAKSITMREVAGQIGWSYSYFSKQFKEYTGQHFADYFHSRRVELSQKYLRDPSVKVQEVARRVGYENPSEFSRAFKKYAGCYPTEYRRESGNGGT